VKLGRIVAANITLLRINQQADEADTHEFSNGEGIPQFSLFLRRKNKQILSGNVRL